jgi:outer membrane receptor protein involved in Fe transport
MHRNNQHVSGNKVFKRSAISLAVMSVLSIGQQTQADEQQDLLELEEIIVTATARPKTKLESSVSVSSMSDDDIQKFTPRSTAEIFRNIPGIRSESTGGEGNANIAVRGLPVASGGAKFLQLQEDGMPVMQFGDIAFGNADIFLRADSTVASVQAIRGGSASTFASNSPGGVINLISKTGKEAGGSVSTTVGVDYDTVRTDFEYGSPFGDGWSFHVGGFFREGDGPRDPGYTANSGGQIKANLTKEFDKGYARVYVKHLDDQSIGYLPMPMTSSGGNLASFDVLEDTIHTPNLLSLRGVDENGNIRKSNVADGMNPVTTSVGFEFSYDLAEDWTLANKFRKSWTDGRFVSPFAAEVGDAQTLADSIGGAGSSLSYVNGGAIADPSALNGNGLAMRVHMFDVEYNDLGNFSNDLKLTKSFENVDITVGYYTASQTIDMAWLWNTYLLEVNGDEAQLLDVTDAGTNVVTDDGLVAYGVPAWGNCCTRHYDAEYDIEAPYISVEYVAGNFTIDASIRHDMGDASGSYASSTQQVVDVDGDGNISTPELSVSVVDSANASPIDYEWSYTSYSVGVNYLLDNNTAVFGRISHGGRANADRLLFGDNVLADGSLLDDDAAVDEVDQVEFGVKYRGDDFGIFATAFYAETEEQNFEATSQTFFAREYEAVGIEFEGSYQIGNFNLTGSATWTDAEIATDALAPEVEGNTPRRQADLIYSLTPSYNTERYSVGANLIGTTDAYAQDNNDLELDGYVQVNAFAFYYFDNGFSVSLNINNLFDETGLTESEEGSVTANNVIRARSINGRTSTVKLKYDF